MINGMKVRLKKGRSTEIFSPVTASTSSGYSVRSAPSPWPSTGTRLFNTRAPIARDRVETGHPRSDGWRAARRALSETADEEHQDAEDEQRRAWIGGEGMHESARPERTRKVPRSEQREGQEGQQHRPIFSAEAASP